MPNSKRQTSGYHGNRVPAVNECRERTHHISTECVVLHKHFWGDRKYKLKQKQNKMTLDTYKTSKCPNTHGGRARERNENEPRKSSKIGGNIVTNILCGGRDYRPPQQRPFEDVYLIEIYNTINYVYFVILCSVFRLHVLQSSQFKLSRPQDVCARSNTNICFVWMTKCQSKSSEIVSSGKGQHRTNWPPKTHRASPRESITVSP